MDREWRHTQDRIDKLRELASRQLREMLALRAIAAACRAHPVTDTLRVMLAEMDARTGFVHWTLRDDQRLVQALVMMPNDGACLDKLPKMLDLPREEVDARIDALIAVFGAGR